ncbi:ATP-binding protein [Streptomyces sp. NPDC006711]|uniref:ATP-binding protein n=1 Tax=Streptomyces sp. NPDC006711 TaxID=3364762 RepID=UPI0036A1E067
MDPTSRGPEEFNRADDTAGVAGAHAQPGAGPQRPPRDKEPASAEFTPRAATQARTVQLVAGDFLLTVNPVDGSEIENCPPGAIPRRAPRRAAADRAEHQRAALPPLPPGLMSPTPALLERAQERARLVRLLGRGRSVRLTGAAGSGRSALLDAVAADCAELAPDGVVRLSGHRRGPTELLRELYATVFDAPLHRLDRATLLGRVRDIGAVVVLDDLEFGGSTLEELLLATPECAYLLAATPDVQAPHTESGVEEVPLAGLGRNASLELLEQAVDRPLTDEEANWAGDLWFESQGLPLRFVQAGALLRRRDRLRGEPNSRDPYGFPKDEAAEASVFTGEGREVPLPSLGEGAAPAALLASRLSEAARATLRFAVALGGEVPHQAHLPALVGDTHADASLGELLDSGLLSPAGSRYRLAAGVLTQLENSGYAADAGELAQSAARHYTWWTGHPSVAPERAAMEADAVLAAMSALVPGDEPGHPAAAVELARTAAPVFAAGLHWGAWERALRIGSEAARLTGEVAEEAYFHHELGVLALCNGGLDRARAELEASIGLRGALSDKRGTVAGRRALALVEDRSGEPLPGGRALFGQEPPPAPPEGPRTPHTDPSSAVVTAQLPSHAGPPTTRRDTPVGAAMPKARRALFGGARRNLVAAGAGALLAAVLGTVVTLGATSNSGGDGQGDDVKQRQSANEDGGGDADTGTESPSTGAKPGDNKGHGPVSPSKPGATPRPGTSGRPAPDTSTTPSHPGATGRPSPGASTPGPGKSSTPGRPPGTGTGAPTHPTPPDPTPNPTKSEPPTTPSPPASSSTPGSGGTSPPGGSNSAPPTSLAPAGSTQPST